FHLGHGVAPVRRVYRCRTNTRVAVRFRISGDSHPLFPLSPFSSRRHNADESLSVVSMKMSASEVLTRTEIVARTLPIRAWPKSERPREKLVDRGAHALSDAELLAVLLRSGTRGRNAIELAQAHIVAFGSLRELLTAEWKSWSDKEGVGVARYAA